MKITNHEFKNGMIHVQTDSKDMAEFVFEEDRFDTKAKLIAEINKKIASITKKNNKKQKLRTELNARD